MPQETIAHRIEKSRLARGFSKSDLSRLVDVTPTAVWNWEKNGINPKKDKIDDLAKTLGVTTSYLITGNANEITSSPKTFDEIVGWAAARIAEVNHVTPDRVKISVEITRA